ncbi:N-acyl-D-amino-acid deacylase family protein, partial [Steroidobacter sp.]|uniref:N-acyl-D-amino-acid deacylase family protein n=1 Tax=Steroidobacter sp. TaxID=1978227 RepID=UPI001A412867
MNKFILWTCLLVLGCGQAAAAQPALDVLIVNARIVDGSGNPWYRGSVAIHDGRIVALGNAESLRSTTAKRIVDARDRVVAPGFIDMMGQGTLGYIQDPVVALSQLRQGITTHVSGEGWSSAPTPADMKPVSIDGEQVRWSTFAEYFRILEKHGVPLNVAFNVGAEQVRRVVLGDKDVDPTPAQLDRMKQLVEQAMLDGAHGISSALIYPPGAYAETPELIELAKIVARHGGFYSTHLRNETAGLLGAIDETLQIAREAKIPVHIYHLKASGKKNWPLMEQALAKITAARASGLDVTTDIYPYIRHGNGLDSFLPPTFFEKGHEAARKQLANRKVRQQLRAEIERVDSDWENTYQAIGADFDKVLVTGSDNKSAIGLSIAQVARRDKRDVWDTFFDLVQADTGIAPESMSEAQKVLAMRAPFVMFDTDNGPTNPAKAESTHPRTFGSFPRVLAKYVREDGVISLEEAIRRMTSLAANRIGAFDRGRIAVGMAADLVIFDPAAVRDLATFEKPLQYAV